VKFEVDLISTYLKRKEYVRNQEVDHFDKEPLSSNCSQENTCISVQSLVTCLIYSMKSWQNALKHLILCWLT